MEKLILLTFEDDFVPPDEFDDPTKDPPGTPYRVSKCDPCPFFYWEYEDPSPDCKNPDSNRLWPTCPIKRFFK